MFNKEESNKIRNIKINELTKLKKIAYLYLTNTMVLSLSINSDYEDEVMYNHIEYQKPIIAYLDRVYTYGKTKKYDKKITDLYENGTIIVDYVSYPIDKFYIIHNTNFNKNEFHLKCVTNDSMDILTGDKKKIAYNDITKFKDTTAFINLIESDCVTIKNNIIWVNSKKDAASIINNWDGYLHDKVKETDAIENKKRIW